MEKGNSSLWTTISRVWPLLCLAVLTGYGLRAFGDVYFSSDDYNNLFWVQRTSGTEMLVHFLNPASQFFRPTGMAFYWILLRCCDLDPLPYHAVAWSLHVINVAMIYVIIRRFVGSSWAAAAGAGLFAFQAMFGEIYWNFGTIFELVSTLLVLLAVYIHARFAPSLVRAAGIAIIVLFAIKAKEMAIMLPIVLVLQDVLQPGEKVWQISKQRAWRQVAGLVMPLLIAVWYLFFRRGEIGSADAQNPYYMVFSPVIIGKSYGWYLDQLFQLHFRWALYLILCTLTLGLMVWRKNRLGIFFFLFSATTLLPVIPLVNHRATFYWYLPFLGICGLAASLAKFAADKVATLLPAGARQAVGIILLTLVFRQYYFLQKDLSAPARWFFSELWKERRGLTADLRALRTPPEHAVFYFSSIPDNVDEIVMLSAVQVILRRTDVDAKVVSSFPEGAVYRFGFDKEKRRLTRESP